MQLLEPIYSFPMQLAMTIVIVGLQHVNSAAPSTIKFVVGLWGGNSTAATLDPNMKQRVGACTQLLL